MERRTTGGGLTMRIVVWLAVATAVALAIAAAPQQASAYESYQHGGIDDCETCHENAHTRRTPTNEHCLTCHPGFQVTKKALLCWTCHVPGQDMSASRSDASCTATCHLPGGATVTHAAHTGRSAACTSCHPVSASPSDPAGSSHHTVPAPVLSGFAPGAGLPGATVTISGSHLGGATAVRFGAAWATFVVESDAQLTATVPASATSGPITVITPGGTVPSVKAFIVTVVPGLTMRASPSTLSLSRRVRMSGRLTPGSLGGTAVTLVVEYRRTGVWTTVRSVSRVTAPDGSYTWTYLPARRGAYHARASLAASAGNTAVQTPWSGFRVE